MHWPLVPAPSCTCAARQHRPFQRQDCSILGKMRLIPPIPGRFQEERVSKTSMDSVSFNITLNAAKLASA